MRLYFKQISNLIMKLTPGVDPHTRTIDNFFNQVSSERWDVRPLKNVVVKMFILLVIYQWYSTRLFASYQKILLLHRQQDMDPDIMVGIEFRFAVEFKGRPCSSKSVFVMIRSA